MSSGGFYEAHLTNLPAHLRGHLMRTSAIALQREWIDRLMHEQPNLGKAKHAAATAPIRDKAGRIVRDHKAKSGSPFVYDLEPESKDMGDGAALLAARGETP